MWRDFRARKKAAIVLLGTVNVGRGFWLKAFGHYRETRFLEFPKEIFP